jgi:hypothetical protein
VFVLTSTRDDSPTGPVVRLAADGTIQIGNAAPVAGADVVSLRRQGQPPPPFPHDRPHARFVNGDRVPGRLVSVADDKVRFLAELGTPQEISVPLSSVAAVWLSESAAARAATPAGRQTFAEKRRHDVAVLANGDTTPGAIVAWPADGSFRLDAGGKAVELSRERVHGLLLSTELARAAKPRSAYRQLVLTNGARLSVRSAELAGDELRATTVTGALARIPLAALAAVNVYQGRAVYLSDLAPRKYEHTPYLGAGWPVANDHSVAGLDLRLGGGTYDKGVGLHSQCRVTYAAPAGARRFESVVGLDEQTGRAGGVRVQVLADGKPLLDPAPELNAAAAPRPLRLPLAAGVRELSLTVEFGRGGDVQDHVDWADARFVLSSQ